MISVIGSVFSHVIAAAIGGAAAYAFRGKVHKEVAVAGAAVEKEAASAISAAVKKA